MDLIHFIHVLLKRKFVLLTVPPIAIIAALLLMRNAANSYTAEAEIATGLTDGNNAALMDNEIRMSDLQLKFSNLIAMMHSKRVVDLVSMRLMINDLGTERPFRVPSKLFTSFTAGEKVKAAALLRQKVDSALSLEFTDAYQRTLIDVIESMEYDNISIDKNLKIFRLENSDFIHITYESDDPYLSAFVVNTLASEFIRYFKETSKKNAGEVVAFFSRLTEEKKSELDQKVGVLKEYKIRNRIINLTDQTRGIDGQINQIEIMREGVQQTIPAFEAAIAEIDKKFSHTERMYLESDLKPFNAEILKRKSRVSGFSQALVVATSDGGALRDSLAVAQADLDAVIKKVADVFALDPNVPKQDLAMKRLTYEISRDMAVNNVRSIDDNLRRLQKKFDLFIPYEATITAFERDVDVAAKVYLNFLEKLNEAIFTNNVGADLRQTQLGMPGHPKPSKKSLLVMLAGAISFIACVVVIFVLEYIDLTIRTPKRFARLNSSRLMGYLNQLPAGTMGAEEIFGGEPASVEHRIFRQLLRSVRSEFSASSEAGRIILFTGTRTGSGKSLTMACLAYALAKVEKRVLLVDTHFRQNGLSLLFAARPALEECLRTGDADDATVTHTGQPGVDILGSQGGEYSPCEVAGAAKLRSLLERLAHQYDYVFVEGAPLNSYSDSKELADAADSVVAVVSAHAVLDEPDRRSFEYLASLNGKFAGCILNSVRTEDLEETYGEVERKRSTIRKFVKRIVKRNLN